MTKSILFLLVFFPTVFFGQKTKKVTEKHENPWYKEVYYVLKSDKKIRHGNYQKTSTNNIVWINGYYKNGLKDSIWTEFDSFGKNIESKGFYTADKKVGIWEFFNHKGELVQQYDYTKNELVYFKLDDKEKNKEYKVINGSDTTTTLLDRPPLYIGGEAMIYDYLLKNLNYPHKAIDNHITGKVYVTFTIDINGKTSNHRVTKGIGYGCDEEALKTIKGIPDNWISGVLHGQAVNVEFVFPINFSIH